MEFFPIVVGFLAVCPVIAFALVIAYTRSATVDSAGLTSKIDHDRVLPAPRRGLWEVATRCGEIRISKMREHARSIVVLTTKPTFATWGFFYPVHITESAGGSTVTVGIRSRLVQFGPLVRSAHPQCEAAIEQQLVGSAGV